MKNTELPNHCQECGAWGTNEVHLNTCSRRNINSTAEQIVRATLLRCQFDTLGDKVADVVKDLRAHGLLSEGAPSEESVYLVTIKLPPNPDHNPRAKRTDACAISENCTDSTGEHHTYLARSIEEVQRETRHITRIETVALTAADVASQEVIDDAADEQDDLRLHMLAPQPVIDEDALAEVIRQQFEVGNIYLDSFECKIAARAVAEWLKGQGR